MENHLGKVREYEKVQVLAAMCFSLILKLLLLTLLVYYFSIVFSKLLYADVSHASGIFNINSFKIDGLFYK